MSNPGANASRKTKADATKVGKERRDYENNFFDTGVTLGDGQFPAQYHARTEAERAIGLKQDYVRHLNEFKPELNARYDVTQSEIDALVRRYDEVDLINFERHITSWFNIKDPTHQRLINELYPQYFERRLDQIEANLEVQRRIAHLRLLGPRSADDLRFAYFLETGVIAKPTGPVFDPKTDDNKNSRGLFNPYRLFDFSKTNADVNPSFNDSAWGKVGTVTKKIEDLPNARYNPNQGGDAVFGQGTNPSGKGAREKGPLLSNFTA